MVFAELVLDIRSLAHFLQAFTDFQAKPLSWETEGWCSRKNLCSNLPRSSERYIGTIKNRVVLLCLFSLFWVLLFRFFLFPFFFLIHFDFYSSLSLSHFYTIKKNARNLNLHRSWICESLCILTIYHGVRDRNEMFHS